MDLEKEMYSHETNITDGLDGVSGSGHIKVEEAIQIAKQYALECCKKQRLAVAEKIYPIVTINRYFECEEILVYNYGVQLNKERNRILAVPLVTDTEINAQNSAEQEKTAQDEQSIGENKIEP
jgi:hypothetical protein